MKVHFSDVREFLAELEMDAESDLVLNLVVRVSCRHTRRAGEPIANVSVVAGYLTLPGLVELDRYCGEYFPQGPSTDDGQTTALRMIELITRELDRLHLAVRHGMFVE